MTLILNKIFASIFTIKNFGTISKVDDSTITSNISCYHTNIKATNRDVVQQIDYLLVKL